MTNIEEQIAALLIDGIGLSNVGAEYYTQRITSLIRAELGKMQKTAICAEGFEERYQFALGWNEHADAVDEKLGGGK